VAGRAGSPGRACAPALTASAGRSAAARTARRRRAGSRPAPRPDEPETNGCAEKFIQTLKEQVLWLERFATFEQLRTRVREFALTYNREWLLERHGYRTPAEARQHLLAPAQAAAA
jgi:transposase InsO family protein